MKLRFYPDIVTEDYVISFREQYILFKTEVTVHIYDRAAHEIYRIWISEDLFSTPFPLDGWGLDASHRPIISQGYRSTWEIIYPTIMDEILEN